MSGLCHHGNPVGRCGVCVGVSQVRKRLTIDADARWRRIEGQATIRPAKEQRKANTVPECRFRGLEVIDTLPCAGCNGAGQTVGVKSCKIHGRCTDDPVKSAKGVKQCRFCDDAESMLPREIAPGIVDPIQSPVITHESGWAWRPTVRDRHVIALQKVVKLTEGITAPNRSGQGVLIVGGGKYWVGSVIACRLLREIGYAGRILLWYRGKSEAIDVAQVVGLGVELTNADAFVDTLPTHLRPRTLDGWGVKTFAIMNCGLERLIYQDSDAYFVTDPTPLFSLLNSTPFCFWEDSFLFNVWGPYHGLTPEAVQLIPAVQSGQMIIDVVKHWCCLTIAKWIDDHHDYFCPRNSEPRKYWHGYGDQDSQRVALAHTSAPFLSLGRARWKGFRFTYEHEGKVFIIHRCGSKLFPNTAPKWDDTLPMESRVRSLFDELTGVVVPSAEMPEHQRRRVLEEVTKHAPCRVLVFGAGSDTTNIVKANTNGQTIVLEDDPTWLMVGVKAGAETYQVRYTTKVGDGLLNYCPELDVPTSVTDSRFDVILIDGPKGDIPDSSGRQQAAKLAAKLIAPNGVIFAHDANRTHDAACYTRHLGTPSETLPGPPDLAVYLAGLKE